MSLRLEHSSSVQARPLVISVSEGRSAFQLLRDGWNALFRRAGLAHNVFQSHALLSVWARIFVRDEVIVICAREGKQLVDSERSPWPKRPSIRRLPGGHPEALLSPDASALVAQLQAQVCGKSIVVSFARPNQRRTLLHRPENRNRFSVSTMQQIQSDRASFVRPIGRTAL